MRADTRAASPTVPPAAAPALAPPYTLAKCRQLPKFDRGVSWLCWVYNEEVLIEGYLRRAHAMLAETARDFEIVVIDDCSTDGTNAIIRRLVNEMPEIRLLRNEVNLNVGISSQRAIKAARKEFLFWQTIDWSYDIRHLRVFLELLRTYDVVAGVRRAPVTVAENRKWLKPVLLLMKLFGIKHLTRRSDTVSKALVSVINYVLVRMLFRVPLSDYQNVVFFPTRLIHSVRYESRSSFSNPEGLIKAYWKGASIVEVPISFLPRQAGEAKGTRLKAIRASVADVFWLWFRWVVCGRREVVRPGSVRRLAPEEWLDVTHEGESVGLEDGAGSGGRTGDATGGGPGDRLA
jgi:glycosyltransferase involved in cell wall biosynthesis